VTEFSTHAELHKYLHDEGWSRILSGGVACGSDSGITQSYQMNDGRILNCFFLGSGRAFVTEIPPIRFREEGDRLRADRLSRGLSLREEARRIGVSIVALSDAEQGRTHLTPAADDTGRGGTG
jgi:hypothetical protein